MATILDTVTRPRVSPYSTVTAIMLVLCSSVVSITYGYDGSMINGLNILPSYYNYFHLTPATTGLASAAPYIGGCISGLCYGKVTDLLGRRSALFWAAVFTLVAVVIQTSAQNISMFVVGRILVGFGNTSSVLAGPTYVAETLPYNWRAWGLGIMNDFYYVGGLIAAGVTYGTASIDSTWAWRIPSLVQGVFSVLCIIILPFIPESPRWLIHSGRREEALTVVAQTHSDGDETNVIVLAQYKQIVDTLDYEKNVAETSSLKQIVKNPSSRKRVILAISCALATIIPGNQIVSYYFGTMLNNAGITDSNTQLEINIILNAFCLVCAIAGTHFADKLGRRPNALVSTGMLTVCLFIVGVLTKEYGTSTNEAGIYATVAFIFLFMGAYSFGWTPLAYMYPPEVLNYSIRSTGMGIFTFTMDSSGLIFVFAFPFALENMGWKAYMMNASWDVALFAFIYFYWVETNGKTLEEIDEVIDGIKHTDTPNIKNIIRAKEDVEMVEDVR